MTDLLSLQHENAPEPIARRDAAGETLRLRHPMTTPVYALAALFASASVVVGVLWDISWHSSIGRDTFWSPPHLGIYLGGVLAGIACGWHVLRTSFAGSEEARGASVTYWKYFRGPLGAWMCIWGAIAMLTSAPFDDWWHNAYGLDVKILSPPHAVLALGILGIQLGAVFMVLALQNQSFAAPADDGSPKPRFGWMFGVASGLVLMNFTIMTTEYTFRIFQHSTFFYQLASGVFVLPLVAVAVAGRMRWPATAATLTYTGVTLALHFILPLFPAEPRLAPILFPVDRMIPPQFPMLLVVPGLAIDLILQRSGTRRRGWILAMALAGGFLITFLAATWPSADFLQSDLARNSIFKQDLRPYMIPDDSYGVLGIFYNPASGFALLKGLTVALGLGTISARLGLGVGGWMSRVQR